MKLRFIFLTLMFSSLSFAGMDDLAGQSESNLSFEMDPNFWRATYAPKPEAPGKELSLDVSETVKNESGDLELKYLYQDRSRCYMSDSNNEITCQKNAPYGLAGAKYLLKTDGAYHCEINCSSKIPKKIEWQEIPNGD